MIISITASEALDKGIWTELCDLVGLNEWAVNEGLMDSSETISLTQEQAIKLGLFFLPLK